MQIDANTYETIFNDANDGHDANSGTYSATENCTEIAGATVHFEWRITCNPARFFHTVITPETQNMTEIWKK